MSNNLDPDQVRHFVGPDLDPNCLQRLSADDTRKQRIKTPCKKKQQQKTQNNYGADYIVILSIIFSQSDDPLSICLQVWGFDQMG